MNVLQYVLDMGTAVVMPIIVTILGLALGLKLSKAFRSGLTIGIGLTAINLVIGLMGSAVTPAATAMTEHFGLNLTVIDVGWPISATISFGTNIVPFVFLVCVALNIIMLTLNWTKTLNIDFWNYWHFVLTGALIQYLTGNMVLGVIGAGITFIIIMKFADLSAPLVQKYYDMPGVSLAHTESVSWAPIAMRLHLVYYRIPGFRNIDWNNEKIQKRFGLLGEPMMLGLLLGIGLGTLAGYDLGKMVVLGVNMAAVMFILPRMVRILMEGLIPISEGDKVFMEKRFPGKELYIGLDAAVAVGSPAVISTSLLMIPITLLLAFILPGNKILPLVDLETLPFFVLWPVIASKGNLFRSLITSTIVATGILYIATDIAPVFTTMAQATSFTFPEGTTTISSLDGVAHLVPYIIYKIVNFINGLF
ncbi:PTS galactitol transporter subunit IIC [Eubacterium aggregans]|uniref:PTS galactitol transporter subunit IIC n=1 Tax=Eubacterium aggregans TaxID=81409 RepID=UPI003F4175AC